MELIEEIAVLSVPEDQADHKRQIHAVNRLRKVAPAAWSFAKPILMATLSTEVQMHLSR